MKPRFESSNGVPVKVLPGVAAVLWWPLYAWQGYLGSYVWKWFAVAYLGAPTLTPWQSAGVIVLAHYFVPTSSRADEERTFSQQIADVVAVGFLTPLGLFLSAALIRWLAQS